MKAQEVRRLLAAVVAVALAGCDSGGTTNGASPDAAASGGTGGQPLPGGEGGTGGTGGQPLPGGDGGAGGAGGAPAPDTTRVTHFPEDCGTLVSLIPAPGEAGQFGLSRITPPSWPFTATAIEYEMFNGLRGDGTTNTVDADQRVLVFKGTDVVPDAVPDLLQESIVPAVAGYEASLYTVVLPLDGAVTLTEGEHLFVAIDFPVDGVDLHSAIAACQQGPGGSPQPFPADRYYRGAALEAPFPWTPLHDFGLDLWLQMSMWGHAGE